jgi:TonB family protein
LKDRLDSSSHDAERDAGLLPVGTLVLWLACVSVGLAGLFWPQHPAPPAKLAPTADALLLTVEATNQRLTLAANPPSAQPSPPAVPSPPQEPSVAPPSPAIAFAEPVNAPVHIAQSPQIISTRPAIIQLTFGEGEGQQPAPDYPPEAVIDGQEGTVVVRLTVDEDGRVTEVIAISPSPWPLLNNAAVRAVRDTWRFRSGPARSYQVSIQFQLNRHE